MNLNLIDPFVLAQDYPETTAASLRSGHASCLRFNHKGDLLASGRMDGVIAVFDIETNGIARKLKCHTRQVSNLSWSRDGRYLLSAAWDFKVVLWDLMDGSVLRVVRFESPLYSAEMHPHNRFMFVAAPFEDQPALVDISDVVPVKKFLPSAPKRLKLDDVEPVNEKQAAQDARMTTTFAIFTASGKHVLAGNSKGWFNIIDFETRETIYSTKLCTAMVSSLRLTSSGRDMVVNSFDRIIRTVQLPNLTMDNLDHDEIHAEAEHKFQDVVNRLSWNHVSFSSTGEYITAATYNNHDIYIWERGHGSLVKILEGKEEHGAVEWHPHRPLIAACGLETGRIHMWSVVSPQKWSALAPDFSEVEENVAYIEQEDEFDVYEKEEIQKRQLNLETDDVDVLTIEPIKGEIIDTEDTYQVPVMLDLDDSESEEEFVMVGLGTMRRKDPNEGKEFTEDLDAAMNRVELSSGRKSKVTKSKKR